jgi:hypothetical protein
VLSPQRKPHPGARHAPVSIRNTRLPGARASEDFGFIRQ